MKTVGLSTVGVRQVRETGGGWKIGGCDDSRGLYPHLNGVSCDTVPGENIIKEKRSSVFTDHLTFFTILI